MGAGRRCLEPLWVTYVGRVPLAAVRAREDCVRADAWGAGRRCVFRKCWVGHTWTLGLVRRPVALSGLLRRSLCTLSEAWHGCYVENNAYSQGRQELGASEGAY
jgi:hypothetical protein